jgi:hypothetical protein
VIEGVRASPCEWRAALWHPSRLQRSGWLPALPFAVKELTLKGKGGMRFDICVVSYTTTKGGTMKGRLAVAVVAVLMLSLGARAQEDSVVRVKRGINHPRMMKILESSLQSDYPGIVEATTFNIVTYRDRYPEVNFSPLMHALESLARDTKDSSLSYKAHLVDMYLKYGTDIRVAWPSDWSDHDTVFRQISEQLEKKFLLSNATQ